MSTKFVRWVLVSALGAASGHAAEFGASASADAQVDTRDGAQADAEAAAAVDPDRDPDFHRIDLEPGIRVRDQGGSALREAARDRRSIHIGAAPVVPKGPVRRPPSNVYTVQEGDTLWSICEKKFGDPYMWPRIWSYNPKITNPHWIYPGDVVFLAPNVVVPHQPEKEAGETEPTAAQAPQRPQFVMLRNRGFVDPKALSESGVIRGAQTERTLLAQFDEAYAEFKTDVDVQVGDEFAAYRILKEVEAVDDPGTEVGKLVEILGDVRVVSFDKDNRVARVYIDEAVGPIERGTRVGPVQRKFVMVPPQPNPKEMVAHVVAHLDPTVLYAQHQVVFVDRGQQDGVRPGNRFFAIKKRDEYRESRNEDDDNEHYPFEIIAELLVIEVRPHTATCLVTGATRELEDGQLLEMVKGY